MDVLVILGTLVGVGIVGGIWTVISDNAAKRRMMHHEQSLREGNASRRQINESAGFKFLQWFLCLLGLAIFYGGLAFFGLESKNWLPMLVLGVPVFIWLFWCTRVMQAAVRLFLILGVVILLIAMFMFLRGIGWNVDSF